jgi:hypothetical protein
MDDKSTLVVRCPRCEVDVASERLKKIWFDKDIRIEELERKVERLEDLLKKREELLDIALSLEKVRSGI